MSLTDLQRFILGYLVENGHVDNDGGRRHGFGATAAELAERSAGWYGNATVVRALNAMSRETAGNADHAPRAAWTRQCTDLPNEVPLTGPRRQWVATAAGASALASGGDRG